jgi:transposase
MYSVEMYERIRRACHVEGMSIRAASRVFGVHRDTVRKVLKFSVPPGYRRSSEPKRPKLDGFVGIIDQILEADRNGPRKQRHTAKRIFERLREEHGFAGSYTIVKDYVRDRKLSQREMFIPLVHAPGHAQVDFGEAWVRLGGIEQKVHLFMMDLPHSDAAFVKAYPAENTEAFLDGHVAAFEFFGGVPLSILYDNTKLAVVKILEDKRRVKTRKFLELQSHYLFADRFGRPGKGNDKGKVEGLVGYARRNFLVPIPSVDQLATLNGSLLKHCRKRQQDRLRGQTETIGERLVRDQAAFLPLPATAYEACITETAQVSSESLVRFKGNDYSVPTRYGYWDVVVKGYVDEVIIYAGTTTLARHPRSYAKADFIYEPLHYLALLEQKVNALDQAAPLAGWTLPEDFQTLRRLLEARMGTAGKREYVQVLRLFEHFEQATVHGAVREALRLGAIGFDAVKHLLLCRLERKAPRLNLAGYPYLPKAEVKTTPVQSYLGLLTGAPA